LRIIVIAAALLAAGPAFAKPATPAQLEMESWRAFKAKDVERIRSLFEPGFVGLYADGTHDLARELQGLKRVTIGDYRLSSFKSRRIDADDVLLTYEADLKATVDGKPVSERLWVSSLWHLDHGRWLTAYHTEIKAK